MLSDHGPLGMASSRSRKWLKISLKQPRIPEFYTLTKIHEKTPVGRPIVSGSSGPTERIYSFVDSLLQPITIKQDTTDFLDLIENTQIPDNVVPATLDVSSLYTNNSIQFNFFFNSILFVSNTILSQT